MQGSLVLPMTDLHLNVCLRRAIIGDATRAIQRLLGRQSSSIADPRCDKSIAMLRVGFNRAHDSSQKIESIFRTSQPRVIFFI